MEVLDSQPVGGLLQWTAMQDLSTDTKLLTDLIDRPVATLVSVPALHRRLVNRKSQIFSQIYSVCIKSGSMVTGLRPLLLSDCYLP